MDDLNYQKCRVKKRHRMKPRRVSAFGGQIDITPAFLISLFYYIFISVGNVNMLLVLFTEGV